MALIEFSQFTNGSALQIGDTVVGLRGGVNTKFTFSSVLSITGTANEITVTGTTAPVIAIANNAILPGSAGVTLPSGNTAARAGGAGTIRFNSQTTELEASLDGITWVTLATTGGTVLSVSGTANRITSTGGVNPVIDISAAYVGQTSIVTLGTVTTGAWNGTLIAGQYGGTGVANTGKTITIGGNFAMSGAFTFTGTVTGNTAVTFPTSGTLATTGGASIPSLVQGDTLYASAANVLSALTKDTNATRYLSNTGTSNNPAWAQIALTTGVTGILPGTNGGTGVNNGASLITIGGNVTFSGGFTFAGTITGNTAVTFPTSGTLATTSGASIPSVAQGDLLYGSAANVLSTLTKDTNATRYLSNTGGSNNPAWAQINLANGVTGTLPSANGGSGVSSPTAHGVLIAEGASAFTPIVLGAGQILIGTTASDPVAAAIGSGSGILVGNSSGAITVSNTGVLSNIATANQTTVSGATGNVTIGLASNAILPGSAGVTLPSGNTAARAGGAGTIRFNSQTTVFESTVDGATWATIETSATGVTSVSGTTNRITASPTTGDVVVDISASYVGQSSITTLGTITTGVWNGTVIDLAHGGTNANLTASNGGIFYSTASAGAILAGTATARQMLQSGASTTPAWSTTTWPATTTANRILYSSATSVIGEITSANSAVLVTNSTGVPAFSGTMTNGQLIIGSTGATPVAATLTQGTGITITNGAGTITIASSGSGGGGLTWLATATASNSATLEFAALFSATYDNYLFVFDRLIPATDAVFFYSQMGTGAGPTYQTTAYYWNTLSNVQGSQYPVYGSNDVQCVYGRNSGGAYYLTNSAPGLSGMLKVSGTNGSSNPVEASGTTAYNDSSPSSVNNLTGWWRAAATYTAIKFYMSSGNITSGTIRMYGMQNS